MNENSEFDNDNKFFGFTGVSKYMLGELIYIPPIKDVNEEIKTTNKYTTIMKIVNKIIYPKVKKDGILKKLNQNIQSFNKTDIFKKIEKDLTDLMSSYDCGVHLEFKPIEVDKVISSVTIQILEEGLEKLPVKFKGTGLQRALLINLY